MSQLPQTKKSLGQHWLTDEVSLQAIVDAASVSSGDEVLEIGPGTGTLTEVLLAKGARVTALEYDQARLGSLHKKYHKHPNFILVSGDIRTFDLTSLPKDYKIVANIPYYLTANLLRKLVDTPHKPAIASLLVQKEVAQRVVASQGRLSPIALFVQMYYQVAATVKVPAHLFTPPPKVDSQILLLVKRDKPLFKIDEMFFKVVKAGFSEPRKKLPSSLCIGLKLPKSQAMELIKMAGIDPDVRPQAVSIEQWYQITQLITKLDLLSINGTLKVS